MDDLDAILIAGPTASGKSALALSLARRHGGVVVNADSMQVYDALSVLTARPGPEETRAVEHFLYGTVPAAQHFSTGDWYRAVRDLLPELKAQGRLPVFVGGTGLYFRALLGGLSEIPEVPDAVRRRWRYRLNEEGATRLHRVLRAEDPETAMMLKPGDGQRIARALEVLEATGRSIRSFQTPSGATLVDPARTRRLVILPERAELHRRIAGRFDAMLREGAIEEVARLVNLRLRPEMPVMRAIGVPEISDYLAGRMSASEARERAIISTRQYAKRQYTWFRNQLDESWKVLATGRDTD